MCKCTPNIRTPFCGACNWPEPGPEDKQNDEKKTTCEQRSKFSASEWEKTIRSDLKYLNASEEMKEFLTGYCIGLLHRQAGAYEKT